MKKLFLILAILILGIASIAVSQSSVYVRPYIKKDGTLVQGHYRSKADGNVFNNWSVYPNVNPYTGVQGTKDPWTEYYRQQNRNNVYGGYATPKVETNPYTRTQNTVNPWTEYYRQQNQINTYGGNKTRSVYTNPFSGTSTPQSNGLQGGFNSTLDLNENILQEQNENSDDESELIEEEDDGGGL